MAGYKVSYQVLSQQGEALKALAKQVDGYASRVDTIRGKLGDDQLLATVRQNLTKLSQQLGESRVVLNMAGEVVTKCVGGYEGKEKSVVKRVDAAKAHNRDFYKNPVVVASAGGAAVGAGAAAGGAAPGATTVNYTDNSTNITLNESAEPAAASPAAASSLRGGGAPKVSVASLNRAIPTGPAAAAPTAAVPTAAVPAANAAADGGGIGAAVGIGAAGVAAVAGGLYGAQKLKAHLKERAAQAQTQKPDQPSDEELESQLARARAEAQQYRDKESE